MARRVYFREIYFYLICLVAIIIFIIGIIMAYDGAINYIRPTTYMTRSATMSMYMQEPYKALEPSEIEALAEAEMREYLDMERNRAFQNLLRGALLIVIAVPLFAFHWRKAQQMWKTAIQEKESD